MYTCMMYMMPTCCLLMYMLSNHVHMYDVHDASMLSTHVHAVHSCTHVHDAYMLSTHVHAVHSCTHV